MKSSVRDGWLRRTWTAIKRGLLGKSSHEYRKQFTGSDEYWDEAIAAQLGWPATQRKATKSESGKRASWDNQN
jgi:hypothetical protein